MKERMAEGEKAQGGSLRPLPCEWAQGSPALSTQPPPKRPTRQRPTLSGRDAASGDTPEQVATSLCPGPITYLGIWHCLTLSSGVPDPTLNKGSEGSGCALQTVLFCKTMTLGPRTQVPYEGPPRHYPEDKQWTDEDIDRQDRQTHIYMHTRTLPGQPLPAHHLPLGILGWNHSRLSIRVLTVYMTIPGLIPGIPVDPLNTARNDI